MDEKKIHYINERDITTRDDRVILDIDIVYRLNISKGDELWVNGKRYTVLNIPQTYITLKVEVSK